MFNIGGGELLVIVLIALIVLGPQRLPDAMRTFGRVVGEVRRISTGFQQELRDAFDPDDEPSRSGRRPESVPLAATVADADRQSEADRQSDDDRPADELDPTAEPEPPAEPAPPAEAEPAPRVAPVIAEALEAIEAPPVPPHVNGAGDERAAS